MTFFFLKNSQSFDWHFYFVFGSLVILGEGGFEKKDKCRGNELKLCLFVCLFDLGLGLYLLTHATVLRYVHVFYPKLQIPTIC